MSSTNIQKAALTKWKRREKDPMNSSPRQQAAGTSSVITHASNVLQKRQMFVTAAPHTWKKNTINFVFVFQRLQT